jgi:hypothetical protein
MKVSDDLSREAFGFRAATVLNWRLNFSTIWL